MKALVAQAHALYHQAAQSNGSLEHCYTIAGFRVRLCFAGVALPSLLLPALEHLAVEPQAPVDLTVFLWDSTSTATPAPHLPLQADTQLRGGELSDPKRDKHIRVAIDTNPHILKILDHSANVGLFWIRDAAQLPPYQRAAPILQILLWWLEQRRFCFLHAGAVGTHAGGVLLAGQGGSGKSSTALTCLYGGMQYLSDDFCVFCPNPVPQVYSLYSSGKLLPDSQVRLQRCYGNLAPAVFQDNGKNIYFHAQTHSEQLMAALPLRAILLPRVTSAPETRLTKTTPAQCLHTLAPSSLSISTALGGDVGLAFLSMRQLVSCIPSYVLHLGTDISQIPVVIAHLLDKEL